MTVKARINLKTKDRETRAAALEAAADALRPIAFELERVRETIGTDQAALLRLASDHLRQFISWARMMAVREEPKKEEPISSVDARNEAYIAMELGEYWEARKRMDEAVRLAHDEQYAKRIELEQEIEKRIRKARESDG